MKKYLNFLYIALLAMMSVSLTACEDNEPSTFTVNGTSYGIHKATGATNTFTDYGSRLGSKIEAELYPSKSNQMEFYPRVHVSLETPSGELSKGMNLDITGGYVEYITYAMEGTTYENIQSGNVTVSNVSSSSVTLKFNRFTLKNDGETLVLDGTLSFSYNKIL